MNCQVIDIGPYLKGHASVQPKPNSTSPVGSLTSADLANLKTIVVWTWAQGVCNEDQQNELIKLNRKLERAIEALK